jgi:hypothetical protein
MDQMLCSVIAGHGLNTADSLPFSPRICGGDSVLWNEEAKDILIRLRYIAAVSWIVFTAIRLDTLEESENG